MNTIRSLILLHFALIFSSAMGQRESIAYELNGRLSNDQIEANKGKSRNPFSKFVGEWTLKNNDWTQNWGNGDEKIKIPRHHTVSMVINTDLSLLSVIDGPEPNGHIFWSLNPDGKTLHHLSSFGTSRTGVGAGTINELGDLSIKVAFSDEASGTYRLYTYKWVSADEYVLKSVQYDATDKPTGFFYSGNFIRINR